MEKETTAKSGILRTMKQVRPEFLQLIKARMSTENLGIRELARRIGVSHPTVTEVVTYGNMPSFDTCIALAAWLDIPKERALRMSGLLPPDGHVDEWVEQMDYKLNQIKNPGRRRMAENLINALADDEEAEQVPKRRSKPKPAAP